MSKIPTISVTKDYDDELSDDEREDSDIRDSHTDIEDFDEDGIDRSARKKYLKAMNTRTSPGATDIEDYNDSSSEEENLNSIGGPSVTLADFLEEGMVEEHDTAENKITTITGSRAAGRFLSYLDEDPGCVTDCENMNSSGDELSIAGDVAADISISAYLREPENINISDKIVEETDEHSVNVNDGGEDSPLSVSEAGDLCLLNELFDSETFLVSDAEDESFYKDACGLSQSKEETNVLEPPMAEILSSSTISYLEIADIQEEVLTDVEKLDMDTDEEIMKGSELYLIPKPESHRSSLTDVEDMDISDTADYLSDPKQVSIASIPAPIREITIVKTDVSGQRIASIMPLKDNFEMEIYNNYDQELTDTEEVSGNEQDFYNTANNCMIEKMPEIYNTVTKNSEIIKVINIKRNEMATEWEPTTDVEEFFLPGIVRRKKSSKSKTQSKAKKLLDVKPQYKQSRTDIEEIDVSDAELGNKNLQVLQVASSSTGKDSPDMKTDIEDISGVDEPSVSEGEEENASGAQAVSENSFYSTVTTMESMIQGRLPHKRPLTRAVHRKSFESSTTNNNQNLTDIEDIHLTSDVEENLLRTSFHSRPGTASPHELQDALNDSSVSTVHEKCGSSFDIDKEKHHIKGLKDFSDANTDVEYFNEEIDVGKEKKST